MFEALQGWFRRLFGSRPTDQQKMAEEDKQAGREAPQPADTVKPVKVFLDAEALIKKFKVREAGRDDGARNYPGPKTDAFGDFEVKMAGQCNDALMVVRAETLKQLSRLESRIQTYDITSIETPLNNEHDRAVRELRGLASDETEKLTGLKTAEYLALRSLLHFQRTHGRVSMPKESVPKLVVFFGVLALVFLEAALNSLFFAEAVPGGEVGGSVLAAVASAVNILFSLAAGVFLIKYINHVRISRKLFGWVSILGFGVGLFLGHYVLAAIRNALVTIGDQGLERSQLRDLAIQNFQNPLSILSDANSFLLVLLGVALGAWSAISGARSVSDPYPGYSSVGDDYYKAKTAFSDAWTALRGKLSAKVKELEGTYKQKIKEQEGLLSVFFRLTRDYETALAFHDENRKQIETVCARVLTAYWEENRAVRTARPPEHFGKEANLLVEFPHETIDPEPLREESATIVDEDKVKAEANLVKVQKEAERLAATLDELLDELENTANHRSLAVAAEIIPGSNVEQLFPYATNRKSRKSA